MNNLPFLSGLSEIADNYDAFLIDSWGVMHNGLEPFEGAVNCLRELKRQIKPAIILSNSARRSATVIGELAELGIGRTLISAVVTGGESAWQSLQDPRDDFHEPLGSTCFYLGNKHSRVLFDEMPLTEVTSVEQAQFILNTGPPENMLEGELAENLALAVDHDVKMLCANPDIYYLFGAEKRFCAGEIGRRYEAIGGQVIYHGKPHRLVYEMCFNILQNIPLHKILAVGDSIHTDLKGAAANGIDAVFIGNGIHHDELKEGESLPEAAGDLCRENQVSPIGFVESLCW